MQCNAGFHLPAKVGQITGPIKIEISQVHAQGWCFGKGNRLSLCHGASYR
jgi:hypothetical protein